MRSLELLRTFKGATPYAVGLPRDLLVTASLRRGGVRAVVVGCFIPRVYGSATEFALRLGTARDNTLLGDLWSTVDEAVRDITLAPAWDAVPWDTDLVWNDHPSTR